MALYELFVANNRHAALDAASPKQGDCGSDPHDGASGLPIINPYRAVANAKKSHLQLKVAFLYFRAFI